MLQRCVALRLSGVNKKFMQRRRRRQREQQKSNRFKVMLHETIRNNYF